MKFSSSSASSVSASSTATYEVTSKVGCISGVLRLLFCSTSLPSDHMSLSTYQSDHSTQTKFQQKTPGVVAKLMGLDSMPDLDDSKVGTKTSISRSRSMNSVDSFKQLESMIGRNRRANSFREQPTYLELEDENFFILSFESGSKQRETEMDFPEIKQRRKEKLNNRNKENLHLVINKVSTQNKVKASPRVSSNILGPIDQNSHQSPPAGIAIVNSPKAIEGAAIRRKKKKKKVIESDSEKSSPNSVLDLLETQNSDKLLSSRSRRTLYEELENYRKLKLMSENGKAKRREEIRAEPWKRDDKYVHLWRGICRLADRETEERNWLHKQICEFEHCKEIGGGIALQILDLLLEELLDQLVH